jgi:dUTP pyrophosphatase
MSSRSPILSVLKVLPGAETPKRSHPTDSGLDLYACRFEKVYYSTDDGVESTNDLTGAEELQLMPGCRALVHTGISATVGVGYEIQIRPRSGLALKQGLTVLNTPGTVDQSYTGPICVILINHSGVPQTVKKGDRIAQAVVCPVILCDVIEVKDLNETARNAGGFGSTGA